MGGESQRDLEFQPCTIFACFCPALYCLFAIIVVYIITCTPVTSHCSTQSPFIFKDQCGNVAVPVEKLTHKPFPLEVIGTRWDEEHDLQTETVEEKLEIGTDESSSVSDDEGMCRSLWQTS